MIGFVAADDDVGRRVDVVVAERAGVTRALAQRALRAGSLRVDGSAVRPSHRLRPGDRVEGDLPPPELGRPEAENIPIHVRYADDRVLVVSKPAGLVTHPAKGHASGTLVNALLALGGPLSGRGSSRPGIVHRLDKDTSGLLLVARDDAAQRQLVDALRRREVERTYLALVHGAPRPARGTIDAAVGRHPARPRLMAVTPGGRPAVTHYEVLATSEGAALLDVRLETGRTHQIRVHLSHLGHPVLGDRTYGGATELAHTLGLARPFLHARRVAFPHPDDGRRIVVEDALPADLDAVLEAAGLKNAAPSPARRGR
jgi:23S rRNA pseudouridine1911/1915/1917 synthase